MSDQKHDAEVLIVGGGPAGLATAIAARAEGLDALVVDRGRPPIDKACGEGLMPDGLALLEELGVRLERFRPFHGIRYFDGDVVAEGRFPAGPGAGVRRLHLHRALVRRAEEVGVRLRWRTRVRSLDGDAAFTDAGPITARFVVGADGLRSRVRRWAGFSATSPEPGRGRFGVRRHFAVAPWSDCVEVYWSDTPPGSLGGRSACEAYVTPVAEDEVGVAVLWSGWKSGFDDLLARFPALAERLRGAPAVSRDRGAGPLRQRVRRVVRGRVALVGDASGYVDAITGEGLSLAFHQARALATAMKRDDLSLYARRHRRIGLLPDAMTHLLLWIEKRPLLRRRLIRAFAREPAIFSRFLALHARAAPIRRLAPLTPRLLWRMAFSGR